MAARGAKTAVPSGPKGNRKRATVSVKQKPRPLEISGENVDAFRNAGVKFGDVSKLDSKAANEFLGGAKWALDELGVPLSDVSIIQGSSDNDFGVVAFAALDMSLNLDNDTFQSYSSANFLTSDFGNKGRLPGNVPGISSSGAHEAGHIAAYAYAKKVAIRNGLGNVIAANNGHITKKMRDITYKALLDSAETVTRKVYASKYAKRTNGECVAEAVADVYKNGKNAKKFSRVVFDLLKGGLSG